MLNEEDEDGVRTLHTKFCTKWKITYPLHSSDIRHRVGKFAWLSTLSKDDHDSFMTDLSDLAVAIPVLGHACVVDRPGYDRRYREKYGRQTWMLCKTAFAVVCERAAKYASSQGRKLRVYAEKGDKTADSHIRRYYKELQEAGMPFAQETSSKYAPLTAAELRIALYDLKFKDKTSALA